MNGDVFGKIFVILFIPAVLVFFFLGVGAITWFLANKIEEIIANFKSERALSQPAAPSPISEVAKQAVIQERERQDRLRKERLQERQKEIANRGDSTKSWPSLPGLPFRHEATSDPLFLICASPLNNPTWFHSIRWGRHGTNLPRIFFTPLKSLGFRFNLDAARKTLRMLDPEGKKLFIVPDGDEVESRQELDLTAELTGLEGNAHEQTA